MLEVLKIFLQAQGVCDTFSLDFVGPSVFLTANVPDLEILFFFNSKFGETFLILVRPRIELTRPRVPWIEAVAQCASVTNDAPGERKQPDRILRCTMACSVSHMTYELLEVSSRAIRNSSMLSNDWF